MTGVELSVVIPIRNEAPSLVELHREFTETLTAWGHPYEIIVVDDGARTRASRFCRVCSAPIRTCA
jgi:cellulose synthase/poly-beta-1,6-N-acetylglucosamine synthase-like glycosyltransferase